MNRSVKKHPVKALKLQQHLQKMYEIDKALYMRILDRDGFAYHFNEICFLAMSGDDWDSSKKNADADKERKS